MGFMNIKLFTTAALDLYLILLVSKNLSNYEHRNRKFKTKYRQGSEHQHIYIIYNTCRFHIIITLIAIQIPTKHLLISLE